MTRPSSCLAFLQVVESHFAVRQRLASLGAHLGQLAALLRTVQKQLLIKFKVGVLCWVLCCTLPRGSCSVGFVQCSAHSRCCALLTGSRQRL